MHKVRIWAPESDNDSKVILRFSRRITQYFQYEIQVSESSKKAYIDSAQSIEKLKRQVEIYLQQDELLIFLIDADSEASLATRRAQPNSMINRIEKIIGLFPDKVKLILVRHEIEAWLLVDYLGICIYYTGNKDLRTNSDWLKFANKHQMGNTELIVEPELGGKNAKEVLIAKSREIIKKHNLKLQRRDLSRKQYCEAHSPAIAECLLIDQEAIRRNSSLELFRKELHSVANVESS
jgi:hypothetical protein